MLSVFFFSSYFLFRNHFCPFFLSFFHTLILPTLPTTFHFSRLEGLSQWWISKRFQTTPLCPRKKLDHMNIYTYKKFQVNLLLSRTYNSCPLRYIQYQSSSCLVSTCKNLIFDGVVTEHRCSEMNITWLNWSGFKCRLPEKSQTVWNEMYLIAWSPRTAESRLVKLCRMVRNFRPDEARWRFRNWFRRSNKKRTENAWERTHKWLTLSFRIVKKNNSTMLDRASPSIAPHIVAEWIL